MKHISDTTQRTFPPSLLIRLGIAFVLFLVLSIGFTALADEVLEGDTLQLDQAILQAIYAKSTPFWDTFFLTVTHLGGVAGVIVITAALIGALVYKKKYRYALLVGLGVGGAALINIIMKLFFERTRPDLWEQLVVETSFSFPSGHSMASAALAFSIIAVFWHTKYRVLAAIAAAVYMLVIGFSRLYLGVHYPTDVLAGWVVSGAWVLLIVAILYGYVSWRRPLPN